MCGTKITKVIRRQHVRGESALHCDLSTLPKEGAEMNIAFLIEGSFFGGYWLMAGFNHFKNLNYMSDTRRQGNTISQVAVAGTGVIC